MHKEMLKEIHTWENSWCFRVAVAKKNWMECGVLTVGEKET